MGDVKMMHEIIYHKNRIHYLACFMVVPVCNDVPAANAVVAGGCCDNDRGMLCVVLLDWRVA